ncbi:MAG: RpoL/Rpb11 RNA polymerase subunit family protein [Promethearchaeota archaeon]
MKAIITKNTTRELELELHDAGHTICNPIREILFENKHLTFAGYSLPHPLIRKATFIIRTDGKEKPIKVFVGAAQTLIKRLEELRTAFRKGMEAE